MLFEHTISGPDDWGRLFQKPEVFYPLAEYIFEKHHIPFSGIDRCTPGSNAVFRAGSYIIKIFAPKESGIGSEQDYITEQFGIRRANLLNIAAPKLYACGILYDAYIFRYLILAHIEGQSLAEASGTLSGKERFRTGRRLREIVTAMDTPCEAFNSHVLFGKKAEARWQVFSPQFRSEREACLKLHGSKEEVFVHGDLNPDNIIIDKNRELYLIDFADALAAPVELELAGMIIDGFRFDPDFVRGFCGRYNKEELAEALLYGVLIHDYGVNIIQDNIGIPGEIYSVQMLRDLIAAKL